MSQESLPSVIRPADVEPITTSTYPSQFQERVRGRIKWRLGTSAGLANLSVVLVELPPGVATSLRMWQTAEDEFAYVLDGHPTLITDTGEIEMSPGESVGFPAGRAVGHHFVNRGPATARLLEGGLRQRRGTNRCTPRTICCSFLHRSAAVGCS